MLDKVPIFRDVHWRQSIFHRPRGIFTKLHPNFLRSSIGFPTACKRSGRFEDIVFFYSSPSSLANVIYIYIYYVSLQNLHRIFGCSSKMPPWGDKHVGYLHYSQYSARTDLAPTSRGQSLPRNNLRSHTRKHYMGPWV